MAAGLTASLTKGQLDEAIGRRLLQIERLFYELAEIKEFADGYTDQGLADLFPGSMTSTDGANVKGALSHAMAARTTWNGANKVFVDRLTGLGVQ